MADSDDEAATPRDDQRGPWLLALGTLAIGVLAFLWTALRSVVRRLRATGEDHRPERRQ